MSKSLIRLVDEAILPAFIIVGAKVFSIAIINNLLSLNFYFQNLGKLYYSKQIDTFTVNTFSDFSVYFVLLIGISVILVKLLFFADNKTKPSIILKLAKANKVEFIQTSIEIYHILFVWMVFFTGLTVYIFVRAISLVIYPWICIPCIVIYLVVLLIIIKEVEKDIVKRLDIGKKILV